MTPSIPAASNATPRSHWTQDGCKYSFVQGIVHDKLSSGWGAWGASEVMALVACRATGTQPLSGAMNETENRSQMQVVSYFSTSHVFPFLFPCSEAKAACRIALSFPLAAIACPCIVLERNIHSLQDLLEGWQVFSFWQALLCFLPQSLQEKTLVCRPSPNTPA